MAIEELPATATEESPRDLASGLRVVRRRRLLTWLVVAGYLPAMEAVLVITRSQGAAIRAFLVWFVILFLVAFRLALARCPRCGNYFHMNGMTFLPLRRCLHCQLHVSGERQPSPSR